MGASPARRIQGLRAWFGRSAGRDVDARDVLITPGGQAAISAVVRALVPAGGPLLVESPTYTGVLAVARAAGIRTVPVPSDDGGVVPEALADAFGRTGAQAFYLQPTFHNPTGAVLAASRRRAVLDIAADAGAFVIEDDYARWLSHGDTCPAPLLADDTEGRVITITSLTKPVAPSLRIGAIVARGPVARRLRDVRVVDDMFVSRVLQEATLDFVARPAWDRHIRSLCEPWPPDLRQPPPPWPPTSLRSRSRAPVAACTCGWSLRPRWTTCRWRKQLAEMAYSCSPADPSTRPRRPPLTCASPSPRRRPPPSSKRR